MDPLIEGMFKKMLMLEDRVSALEAAHSTSQVEAVPDQVLPKSATDLRPKAIRELRANLERVNPEASLHGSYNRGSNPLVITGPEGDQHRIYLTSSRDYNEDQDDFFSSWHTIKVSDVESGVFEAFVLVPFNKMSAPEFFVYTAAQMRAATRLKKASGGFYHFYVAPEGPGVFVDRRTSKASDETTDITQFHNAWHSLPGVMTHS